MYLEEQCCIFVDCVFVVPKMGPIRGPYLAQDGSARFHHIGDTERATNFDEFATGYDDLFALR